MRHDRDFDSSLTSFLFVDQTCNLYESVTIDNFLSNIDHDAKSGLSSQQGPFSAFPAKPTAAPRMDASTSPSDVPSMPAVSLDSQLLDEIQGQELMTQRGSPLQPQLPGTESTPDMIQWWSFYSSLPRSCSISELDNSPSESSPLSHLPPTDVESIDQQGSFDSRHINSNHRLTPASGAVRKLSKMDARLPRHI